MKRLVAVYWGTSIDSGFVKNILEMNGINAFLRDEAIGILAPWYITPDWKGAVKVIVPENQSEEAIQLMKDYFVYPIAPRSVLPRALTYCFVALLIISLIFRGF